MRGTATIPPLLAAGLIALGGCVQRVQVEDMAPSERAAAADVRFYENLGAPKGAYETLGPVEATSCQTTRFDEPPSPADAVTQLRIKVAQLGGDGVIQFLCSPRGPSFVPACSRSITCAGTAIKIAKRGGGNIAAGGSGSGFFINAQGDLITNAHVTNGCSKVTVRVGDASNEGDVVYQDRRSDLALVRTGRASSAFLRLRVAPAVQLAETVVTAGFPLGGTLSAQIHITDGSVSSLAGYKDDTRELQFTAPIQPGNSGGPLVDLAGNLVGVNSATIEVAQNVNFAIKAATVITFLDSARAPYHTATSGASLAKTEVAASTARATVKLICDPSTASSSS